MTNCKAAAWTWIVGTLLGVPLLYVLSFGPACWISSHVGKAEWRIETVYRPVLWAWARSPGSLATAIDRYAECGAADGWQWNWLRMDSELSEPFSWDPGPVFFSIDP